jgi:hypothetical protein
MGSRNFLGGKTDNRVWQQGIKRATDASNEEKEGA